MVPPAEAKRTQPEMLAVHDRLGPCEQRLEGNRHGLPTVAIVGASYTAGVGPGVSTLSWAADLARMLHWNAVIYGDPGAGYVSRGGSDLGPVIRLLTAERLRDLAPSLVIIQAGHDDAGVATPIERQAVIRAIEEVRARAPRARIALLTVFTRPRTSQWLTYYRTDQAIVTAARAADHTSIIMDPLTGRWRFTHFHGSGLHPTAAGDADIARRVYALLRAHGIRASSAATAAVTCQVAVGVGLGPDAAPGTARDALTAAAGPAYPAGPGLRRRRPLPESA